MKVIKKRELIEKLRLHSNWLNDDSGEKVTIFNKIIGVDIDAVFLEDNSITLQKASFSNCFFHGIMLNQVNLEQSSFDNCSFKDAIFHRVNLEKSHFEKIQGEKISVLGCNIKEAIFQDITLTTIRLESLTSFQTHEAIFINCYFNEHSSIVDCTFTNTKFSKIKLHKNVRIKNVTFTDCIFDSKEDEGSLKNLGANITFSKYKLMSWEIIISDEAYTSYVYTFFTGLKDYLIKKYDSLYIEWEHTDKPSVVLHINVVEQSLLPSLIFEIQQGINQFFENLFSERPTGLVGNIQGQEELHSKLYKIIGVQKTLQQFLKGALINNIKDFENNDVDLMNNILKIPEINVIIGDNNIIGNNNTKKEYLFFSKKDE